jgi:hypothetical protein
MNSTLFTSDRATHFKIGTTAVIATVAVIVVGVFAKPVTAPGGPAMRPVAGVSVAATVSQGLPVAASLMAAVRAGA